MPSKRPTSNADEPVVRWGVYKMRRKGERLGSVEAATQSEAMQAAFERFDIAEAERWRISVQRE